MEKYGFVYIWLDRKHKRYYIGSHWGTEDDGYVCSSNWMKQAYIKRPQDFRRRIIAKVFTTRKELLNVEQRWLNLVKDHELGKRYYNVRKLTYYAWHTIDNNRKATIRERIAEKAKAIHNNPEIRQRYLEGIKKRKPPTPEALEKRRQAMKRKMAEKYPLEGRKKRPIKFGSDGYKTHMSEKIKELWNRPGHRELVAERKKNAFCK